MTQTAPTLIQHHIEEGKVLILERVFRAPQDLVFEAFTTAEHLSQWWAPQGWEVPYCTVDLQVGGKWHYCMKCTDESQGQFYGMESWGLAVYEDIQAPSRLVYTDYFSDRDAGINENLPSTLSTLTFETVDGGTRVTTRAAYGSEEALKTVLEMGMLQGIAQTWDRLAEHLAAQQA